MVRREELIQNQIRSFQLPAYTEIPNVGLFLEQVSKYIGEYTEPLGCVTLTGSMISNYVKKKIVSNPVKKQYDREQIAYLFFIAIAKSVMSLEDIQLILSLQKERCGTAESYEYFRKQLKIMLELVAEAEPEQISEKQRESRASEQECVSGNALQTLLRKILLAVSHKVYIDKSIALLREEQQG